MEIRKKDAARLLIKPDTERMFELEDGLVSIEFSAKELTRMRNTPYSRREQVRADMKAKTDKEFAEFIKGGR